MKIAYITMGFPKPSETFISTDIHALQELGMQVEVYGLRGPNRIHKKLVEERNHDNLKIKNSSFKIVVKGLSTLVSQPRYFFSLLFWTIKNGYKNPVHFLKSFLLFPSVLGQFVDINNENYDVIHLVWGHYPSMLGFLVHKYNKDVVLSHFLGAYDLTRNYPGSVSVANNADLVFTHSSSNLELLKKRGIDRNDIKVIHRGTAALPFFSKAKISPAKEEIVFLTASRLIETKGVQYVLQIFEQVHKVYPNSSLRIAGDGNYLNTLKNKAADLKSASKIYFLGRIDQTALLNEMANADFFILMSHHPSERLPNVVKEAMAMQCFIVTTKTIGIDELLLDGVTGRIVAQHDYQNAAKAIFEALADPENKEKIQLNAQRFIEKSFDVYKLMERYKLLWEAKLKNKKSLETETAQD